MTKELKIKLKNKQLLSLQGIKLKGSVSEREAESDTALKKEKKKSTKIHSNFTLQEVLKKNTTKSKTVRAKKFSSFSSKDKESKHEEQGEQEKSIYRENKKLEQVDGKEKKADLSMHSSKEEESVAFVEKPGGENFEIFSVEKTIELTRKSERESSLASLDRKSSFSHQEETEISSATKKGTKKRNAYSSSLNRKEEEPSSYQRVREPNERKIRSGSSVYKQKKKKKKVSSKEVTSYPKQLTISIPISVKEMASYLKRKSIEIIQKLFSEGIEVQNTDLLDNEVIIHHLGEEFGCNIHIDTSQKNSVCLVSQSVEEEISKVDKEKLAPRIPVIAFMGHVDHGKTSLIDSLRKSSLVEGESGSITQRMSAFLHKTQKGELTILDTPGHEAFSSMRLRGVTVTDIIVLVIAGNEGIKEQTREAIDHAKSQGSSLVIAINKCDKPEFNAENVYRQLTDLELLPELWGGKTITVNCSALTGEGIPELLEMILLQAELLELRANREERARGVVIESQLKSDLGNSATILVQNGALHLGDALVLGGSWGKVRRILSDRGENLTKLLPGCTGLITGISSLPDGGEEWVVVKEEKEARKLAEVLFKEKKLQLLRTNRGSFSTKMIEEWKDEEKKQLFVLIKADTKGSLEAIQEAFSKIPQKKVSLHMVHSHVGVISTSDLYSAQASKAIIIGFNTQVERSVQSFQNSLSVPIYLYSVIYDLIKQVRSLMEGLLEKAEERRITGKANILSLFRGSKLSKVAGCRVIEGKIQKGQCICLLRKEKVIWQGVIFSIRREKDIVSEVVQDMECGIVLKNFNQIEVGDVLEAFEKQFVEQKL